MFPKIKRVVDKKLLERIRELPCIACRKPPRSHPHHVKTVGSGGGDTIENVVPVCFKCHREWHDKGKTHMINKYPGVAAWWRKYGLD